MNSFLYLPALTSLASGVLAAPAQPVSYDISATLQNILQNTHGSNLYTYPTDLTRGIIPVCIQLLDLISRRIPPNWFFRKLFTLTMTIGEMFHFTVPFRIVVFRL